MSEMNDSKDELSVHLDVHSNEGDVVDVVKYATDVLNNGLLNGQEEEEEEADDGEDSNGNHHGNIPRHCLKGPSSHDLGEHRDETDVKDDDAVAVDIDRFRMEMESMGEININGLSGDQPVFPTIEAMRTVQQQRKKRQFSSIIDEDIKEFQRWTSRFLVDALDDSTTDVAIEDSDEYGFPQTTAEHFTDPVDDSSFKRKKIVKNETPDTHATDRKGSDSNLHEQNDVIVDVGQQNGIDLSKKKVNIIKFEGLDIDKEEHLHTTKNEENVDPELSKFDSNTFSDDLINVSLEYLQRRIESGHVGEKIADGADNDVGNRTVDGDNNEDADDDENLAVEEVNRVVNQAVAAVRADAARNEGVEHIEDVKELDGDGDEEHGADTDVIAAAIVAAENAVRKRLKIDSMGTLDQIKDISIPITNEPTLTTDQSSSKVLNFQKVKVGADGGGLETSTKPKKANKKNATTKQTVSKAKKNKEKRDEFELLIKGKLDEAIKKAREKIADLSINSRSFTKEEMDAIDIFIKEYQKVHVMTHEAFLKRIWGNERKKDKFWEVVQHVLPNRTRSSLYKHIRRTYHIFEKRGVWTPEEDKKLKELTETCDGKWKEIGEIMKRMPEDCRDRWRNYVKCGESRNVNKWTKEEEDRLKEIITQVLDHARKDIDGKEQPIREAQVAPTINWNIISEMMGGTRSRIQCRYKWKKIMKMESVNKLQKMDSDTQQWLIERLYELSEKDPYLEANLDWDALALTAPSSKIIWNGVDLSTCFARLKTRVDWKGKTFFEIVAQLRDALSPAKCVAQLENNQVWNVEGETH